MRKAQSLYAMTLTVIQIILIAVLGFAAGWVVAYIKIALEFGEEEKTLKRRIDYYNKLIDQKNSAASSNTKVYKKR